MRERGVGLGKVREPGLELGMPEAQWHYMLARCPQGHRRRQQVIFYYLHLLLLCYSGITSTPFTS